MPKLAIGAKVIRFDFLEVENVGREIVTEMGLCVDHPHIAAPIHVIEGTVEDAMAFECQGLFRVLGLHEMDEGDVVCFCEYRHVSVRGRGSQGEDPRHEGDFGWYAVREENIGRSQFVRPVGPLNLRGVTNVTQPMAQPWA